MYSEGRRRGKRIIPQDGIQGSEMKRAREVEKVNWEWAALMKVCQREERTYAWLTVLCVCRDETSTITQKYSQSTSTFSWKSMTSAHTFFTLCSNCYQLLCLFPLISLQDTTWLSKQDNLFLLIILLSPSFPIIIGPFYSYCFPSASSLFHFFPQLLKTFSNSCCVFCAILRTNTHSHKRSHNTLES